MKQITIKIEVPDDFKEPSTTIRADKHLLDALINSQYNWIQPGALATNDSLQLLVICSVLDNHALVFCPRNTEASWVPRCQLTQVRGFASERAAWILSQAEQEYNKAKDLAKRLMRYEEFVSKDVKTNE